MPFLRSLRVRNLLSFGPESEAVELRPLNVLIGANASGKSNLIDAIDVLRSTPGNLIEPIRRGGGVAEWLWKGGSGLQVAEIEAQFDDPESDNAIRHKISFTMESQRFRLVDEVIDDPVRWYYASEEGSARSFVNLECDEDPAGIVVRQSRLQVEPGSSVLSNLKDPNNYPELFFVSSSYERTRIYREWSWGRNSEARRPQSADTPNDTLLENATNLALVLNDLEHAGRKSRVLEEMRGIAPNIRDFSVKIHGGTVQLYLHEDGLAQPVPATRLSDGTLHFLCLLAILLHPSAAPLVCIEEPEIGMHPDMLPRIVDLMVEASQRTQLIVATHSPALIDALSDHPDSVLVCEKEKGSTTLRRLSQTDLKDWLEKYSLGDLWTRGQIGGVRY